MAILMITVLLQGTPSSPRGSLPLLSATIHRNLANGSLKPELQSESDREVEEYFQSRAPFPVRCPPRIDSGFSVSGAGLCDLAGHPAAVVVGSIEKRGSVERTPVSLIVMAKDQISNFSEHTQALTKSEHVEWSDGELNVVVSTYDQNLILATGATGWQDLRRLLDAYGSYPH